MATSTTPFPAAAPVAKIAELVGAVKRFGAKTALGGVDFSLAPGEVVALLGPNGAGKTTAVKLLLGLTRPDAGTATLFGKNPYSRAARERVGVMLQVSKVPETLTPREHLDLFASYYPQARTPAEALAAMNLLECADRPFGKLSGGERQRTLFALANIGRPELLVLDEPTVGLDVEARRTMWAEIRRQVEGGCAMLLTTHYLEEADALADRVVVLHDGQILAQGTPAEIKQRTAGRRVRLRTRTAVETALALPGVLSATRDGAALEVLTARPEPVVAALLTADPDASDLEVTATGLEDAFLALTRSAPSRHAA